MLGDSAVMCNSAGQMEHICYLSSNSEEWIFFAQVELLGQGVEVAVEAMRSFFSHRSCLIGASYTKRRRRQHFFLVTPRDGSYTRREKAAGQESGVDNLWIICWVVPLPVFITPREQSKATGFKDTTCFLSHPRGVSLFLLFKRNARPVGWLRCQKRHKDAAAAISYSHCPRFSFRSAGLS